MFDTSTMNKYIIFKGVDRNSHRDILVPLVFPNMLVHQDVADRMGRLFLGMPVSAGFIRSIDEDNVYVTGRSDSLNIDGHPKDGDVLFESLIIGVSPHGLFKSYGAHYA